MNVSSIMSDETWQFIRENFLESAGSLAVVAASLLLYFLWIKPRNKYKQLLNLPGPFAFPIVGHLPQYGQGRYQLEQILKFSRIYPNINCSWLAWKPMFMAWTAETAKPTLTSSVNIKKQWVYDFFHIWLGTGLLTSTGAKWKKRRRMLTPAFHYDILKDFVPVMREHAVNFVNALETKQKAEGDNGFDVFPFITRCTLDVITETAMGVCVNAQRQGDAPGEYVKAVSEATILSWQRILSPWYWNSWFYFHCTIPGRKNMRAVKTLHKFTEGVIQKRRSEHERHNSKGGDLAFTPAHGGRSAFLDVLLVTRDEETGDVLTDADIREEVDTFMFEGHDTTAAALCFAVYELGKNIDCQRQLQKELDEVLGSQGKSVPDYDDIEKLEYLDWCIREGLRMYPPVPWFGRTLVEDMTVDGVVFPKGMDVTVFPWAIHRHPKHYENPDTYDPSRHRVEIARKRHPFAYIPFSAGPRNCIGQVFARIEEKIILGALFYKYNVEVLQDDAYPTPEIILRPSQGVRIRLRPRT